MVMVGVTGHRELIDETQLIKGVDQAINHIQDAFQGSKITIISPLAEGADRLIAWRAMANDDVDLVVPLPFALSDYMEDFSKISSKAEFVTLLEQAGRVIELPALENREESYHAVGLYVLDNSDVLVALWDGQPARGPGGTGQIVAEARARKMPIAWVFATGEHTQSDSVDRMISGEVTFENFP